MPRFYFDVFDGKAYPDRDGLDLPDLAAVRREAVRASGEMIKDHADFWDGKVWTMQVKDESGSIICKMQFVADMPSDMTAPSPEPALVHQQR